MGKLLAAMPKLAYNVLWLPQGGHSFILRSAHREIDTQRRRTCQHIAGVMTMSLTARQANSLPASLLPCLCNHPQLGPDTPAFVAINKDDKDSGRYVHPAPCEDPQVYRSWFPLPADATGALSGCRTDLRRYNKVGLPATVLLGQAGRMD